ncbi:MAG: hypothetical protein P8Y23_07665 [Candidatus Lokiarchaeota archaeon]
MKNNDPVLFENLGFTYELLEDYSQALKSYYKALDLFPEFTSALKKVALIHYQQKNFTTAALYYIKLFHLNPAQQYIVDNLISCYKELNDFENVKKWSKIKSNQP